MARLDAGALGRRSFLLTGAAAALAWRSTRSRADDPLSVNGPRATSGDVVEPQWDERVSVTVGREGADIIGSDHRALQAAVDYVAGLGGGTVRILPGTYELRNAVYLRSRVRVVGSGAESILTKAPSVETRLSADSDWYDQEITLADAAGFRLGDGVCLKTRNPHNGGVDVVKRTLVARSGNRFKLDRALRQNFWQQGDTTAATLYPLFSGEEITDFAIESLVLDGNKANNLLLDGNYAGCVFLQDCSRATIHAVEARSYHGDGLSWQVCHDVTVKDCYSHDHAGLGLHPGSGSQRPVMENNRLERNDIGLFFCWGVKFGVARANELRGNRVGVSIGHRDTDNLVVDNLIADSRETGILFRPERGHDFAPHRNRFERNRVVNTGADTAVAVDVQGQVESIQLVENTLSETRAAMSRVGIRIGAEAKDIELSGNTIQGFAHDVQDLRPVAAG
ncbi:MAG: right-handed parallel beta-helix repeat-containing protein [Pirellulales bacterium]|nr:right-handed parallel beta-helix repeat-containing protein [Pirellulales bacterium]